MDSSPAPIPHTCSRRALLKGGLYGCATYLGLSLAAMTMTARRAFAQQPGGNVIKTMPFARIETLGEGVWAIIATPQQDNRVFSNGGIIQGKNATLAVEACMRPDGASWVAEAARNLTGRYPDYVVMTHYHRDHTGGMAAYSGLPQEVRLVTTDKTQELLLDGYKESFKPGENLPNGLQGSWASTLPNTLLSQNTRRVSIDLGGRSVTLTPRAGHTSSDVIIEVDDPAVLFCGDLFFNGSFPYYGDALPGQLIETCRDILKNDKRAYVPGHGNMADWPAIRRYIDLLEDVEAAARLAHKAGIPVDQAWRAYDIPERLGNWWKFRPDVTRFAFEAWYRELG